MHIVIKPDKECVVNSGLGSVRGARMAEMSYSRARNGVARRSALNVGKDHFEQFPYGGVAGHLLTGGTKKRQQRDIEAARG